MSDLISLEGPIELVDGQLLLQIPLDFGGNELARIAPPGSHISDQLLKVVIPQWLADKLNIGEGSIVIVENPNDRFTITRSEKNDFPTKPQF